MISGVYEYFCLFSLLCLSGDCYLKSQNTLITNCVLHHQLQQCLNQCFLSYISVDYSKKLKILDMQSTKWDI